MTMMKCEEASAQKDEVVSGLSVTHFVLFDERSPEQSDIRTA
jgi:hypothetical protein